MRRFLSAIGFIFLVTTTTKAQESSLDSLWKKAKEISTEALKVTNSVWVQTEPSRTAALEKTKELSAVAWEGTTKVTKSLWEQTAPSSGTALEKAKEVSTETLQNAQRLTNTAWEASAESRKKLTEFWEQNKNEILFVGGVIALAAVGSHYYEQGNASYSSSAATRPYAHLNDNGVAKPGAAFSQAAKEKMFEENRRRNGGQLVSDLSGVPLEVPKQYYKGYTPPSNEAQVDHIFPRSQGGTNSFSNAQILSRQENLIKGSVVPAQ